MKTQEIVIQGGPLPLRQAKRSRQSKSEIVRKSNELARSEISKVESVLFGRMLNVFIAQIDRDDEDFHDYVLPMSAIMTGSRGGGYYDAIEKQSDLWLKVTATLKLDEQRVAKYPLFSKILIDRGSGQITVNIHKDLKPLLLQLKDHFTQYPLQEYLRLSTVRTQRLFELLCSWQSMGQMRIDIEKLHNFLGSEEYMRENFKVFRIRVLEHAEKEIKKSTSLYYRWKSETVGRKVTAVVFNFSYPSHEEEQEAAIKTAADLRKKAEKCCVKYEKQAEDCVPEKNAKCLFCQEHGMRPENRQKTIRFI